MLNTICLEEYGKDLHLCSNEECFHALMKLVAQKGRDRIVKDNGRKVYYISAEFLIGKLLSNNLINLGIYDEVKEELTQAGKNLSDIEELEVEPSLGNGGLGRLAACFLDSIANLGLNGDGIGLNYHLGLFKQVFENGKQKEVPNPWIGKDSWLVPTDVTYTINFGEISVVSRMYDINVYGEKRTNKLHLFDVETVDESIVKGDSIDFDKSDIAKNLTLFLYPDDSDEQGRLLRIYQQYFMVSNGARLILDECRDKCINTGKTFKNLPDLAVIQINDTHPTMVIPELIRLLTENGDIDGSPITMDEAIDIVSKSCAYTNHTILAEALEKWPVDYLNRVVPQLMPIIKELDRRVRGKYTDKSVYIIDDNNLVHMAHIDIHYGMSVNGVAKLHTEILENTELNNFYRIYPEKFNNKTNGITFRRWLIHCNNGLAKYIETLIGSEYRHDAEKLKDLLKFAGDKNVYDNLLEIKTDNKRNLAEYLKQTQGIEINPQSIYDIQIKRLHEYKRQQMNALYIIYKYFDIKAGNIPKTPVTVIFGAKAAPAYTIAKDIIHLILTLSKVIEADKDVSPYLKVVLVQNYNVTLAEKLIPACDISEQISLASKEASGTGNMKFMLNGAPTLGTMDGANVEIVQEVGEENAFIFGMSSDQIINYENNGGYDPDFIYNTDPEIRQVLMQLINGTFSSDTEMFRDIYNSLLDKRNMPRPDQYFILGDFRSYAEAQKRVEAAYKDEKRWAKMALLNTACSGKFTSDRTIQEYVDDIWHLDKVIVKEN